MNKPPAELRIDGHNIVNANVPLGWKCILFGCKYQKVGYVHVFGKDREVTECKWCKRVHVDMPGLILSF